MTSIVEKARVKIWLFFYSTRFAWFFFAKILVFCLIYLVIFFARPDAFNFASGYNNNPLTTFIERFYVPDDNEQYFLDDAQDLTEGFRKRAEEVDAARRFYLSVEADEEVAEEAYKAALDTFQVSIDAEIEVYEAEHVVPLESQIVELQAKIDELPYGSPEAPAMIRQKIELLETLQGHLTYIIENRVAFVTEGDERIFDAANRARDEARDATIAAGTKYRELRGELFDHFSTTRNQMLHQIGFWDFLYFSACISTTTTFGDVTANLSWVRMIVVLQILVGIFILAALLDSLRKPSG